MRYLDVIIYIYIYHNNILTKTYAMKCYTHLLEIVFYEHNHYDILFSKKKKKKHESNTEPNTKLKPADFACLERVFLFGKYSINPTGIVARKRQSAASVAVRVCCCACDRCCCCRGPIENNRLTIIVPRPCTGCSQTTVLSR